MKTLAEDMTGKPSPRPWKYEDGYVFDRDSSCVISGISDDVHPDNCIHIVDCVNACHGLKPAGLPLFVEAFSGMVELLEAMTKNHVICEAFKATDLLPKIDEVIRKGKEGLMLIKE